MTAFDSPRSGPSRSRWKWFAIALLLPLGVLAYRYVVDQQRLAKLRAAEIANEKLLARFEQVVTTQGTHNPSLLDRLADFTKQTGIRLEVGPSTTPMLFDRSLNQPLSLELPPLPAHEWLQTMCDLHHASWQVRSDGGILIQTDPDTSGVNNEQQYWRNYPLLEMSHLSPERLDELVSRYVTTDDWEGMGGYSVLQTSPGGITTFQSHRGHLRTQVFLAKLKMACHEMQQRTSSLLPLEAKFREPIWFDGDAEQWHQCLAALDRPITLRAVDMPLADFVAKLSELAKFPVVVHPLDLEAATSIEKKITCDLQQVPLRHALQRIELLAMYTFHPQANGRLLVICDPDQNAAYPAQTLRAYPVADLSDCDAPNSSAELMELLTATVEPDSWADVGGRANLDELAEGKLLLISQTLENHRHIEELLTRLRQVRSGEVRHATCPPNPPLPVRSKEVGRRLAAPLEIDFRGAVESQWFPNVCTRGGIRIPGLEADGLSDSAKMWCHLPARPLHENLEMLFAARGFEMRHLDQVTLKDETIQYDDTSLSVTEVFDLRPWLNVRHTTLTVSELLEAVVAPDSWQSLGGPGSCVDFQDALVVRAHPRVMAKVRHFFAALEGHLASQKRTWRDKPLQGESLLRPLDLFGPTDVDNVRQRRVRDQKEAIEEQLLQRVTLRIVERERVTAILDLARQYKLPIILHSPPRDPTAPDPFGGRILPNTLVSNAAGLDLVTMDFKDQTLGEVLQQLIGDPKFQIWLIKDGYLTIGSPGDEVETEPDFFLYSVDDLVSTRGELQPKQLVRTLQQGLKDAQTKGLLPRKLNRSSLIDIEFRFGNLLQIYNDSEPSSRQFIDQMLRELRSGEQQPLPAQPGDSDYYEPYYPPRFFRPYSTGSVIPIVG